MTAQKKPHSQVYEEITKFEKTMEELNLLRNLSKDIKNYRRMIKLKKYD